MQTNIEQKLGLDGAGKSLKKPKMSAPGSRRGNCEDRNGRKIHLKLSETMSGLSRRKRNISSKQILPALLHSGKICWTLSRRNDPSVHFPVNEWWIP